MTFDFDQHCFLKILLSYFSPVCLFIFEAGSGTGWPGAHREEQASPWSDVMLRLFLTDAKYRANAAHLT